MRVVCLLLLLALPAAQAGQPVTVAVASNFSATANDLVARFTKETGVPVRLVTGSTGKLYAQIVAGAPFDVFLAADQDRPRLLVETGYVAANARFTYAVGTIVLWSPTRDDCDAALLDPDAGYVAIANPAIAPYGVAAREYLESRDLWDTLQARLVYGENILQATQFVATGNAVVGVIAEALLTQQGLPAARCKIALPTDSYTLIRQDAVLLVDGSVDARRFFEFLQSDAARDLIVRNGYRPPH